MIENRWQKYKVLSTVVLCFYTSVLLAQNYPTESIEPFYGINFTNAERDSLRSNLNEYQKAFEALHQYSLRNSIPMSLVFNPLPSGFQPEVTQKPINWACQKKYLFPLLKKCLPSIRYTN